MAKRRERSVVGPRMQYAILDRRTGRPYVPRTWKKKGEAVAERRALVDIYPPGSEWPTRLVVREWPEIARIHDP